MRLDTHLSQRMDQRMILAPRMIQSMEILQLPIMALQERIEQELQENPALELKDEAPEDAPAPEAEAADPANDPEQELVIESDGDNELDFDRLEAISKDWEDHFNEEHRPSRNSMDEEDDKKHDAMQNMPSRPQSLHDYLYDQMTFMEATPLQLERMHFLVTHFNENGWLTSTLDELTAAYNRAQPPVPVTVEELEEALLMLQKLDPPGVGARSLEECLLLQLTPETPYREVVRTLIMNHLEDISHNRLPIIQRRTGFDLETIQAAIEVLKHLNPKPGTQFSANNIPYVVPDIVVERTDTGEYEVRLLDDWVPKIYISRQTMEMYKDKTTSQKDREYLKRKIQAAQWLLESIDQRRNTLEKVTRAIIRHQRAFLDKGPEHIEPLKMQQIADQVGVHVTTVSRAVDDKWVQTPRGIFPLKRFFGGGTQTASGEEVAWETIKQKLLEIIDNEDKSNPLSDEDLVTKLQESGYPVARRTVTKYRKMLNIPSSRQRKDWVAVKEKEDAQRELDQERATPVSLSRPSVERDDDDEDDDDETPDLQDEVPALAPAAAPAAAPDPEPEPEPVAEPAAAYPPAAAAAAPQSHLGNASPSEADEPSALAASNGRHASEHAAPASVDDEPDVFIRKNEPAPVETADEEPDVFTRPVSEVIAANRQAQPEPGQPTREDS